MLIEIHIIQNHAPSNLNRDDMGSPKECVFGEYKRARISSQCLKRTIRRSDVFQRALDSHATRTRKLPELVRQRFIDAGKAPEVADIAAKKASGFGNKDGKEQDKAETAQTMFLTESDIDAVIKCLLKEAGEKSPKEFEKLSAKDLQTKAQQTGYRPVTPDLALFGRMTTSEAFRDVEASAQVAHAISTHKVDHEFDYFTAVDDLQGSSDVEESSGAGMIGEVEFNSACYYKYFSIDVGGLIDNLTGAAVRPSVSEEDRMAAAEIASKTIGALIEAAITVTPTGKQNSFAAHQLPAAVFIEVRPHSVPVSYANAFVKPAEKKGDDDLVTVSLAQFAQHVDALTSTYNLAATDRLLLAPPTPDSKKYEIAGVETVPSLNALLTRVMAVAFVYGWAGFQSDVCLNALLTRVMAVAANG